MKINFEIKDHVQKTQKAISGKHKIIRCIPGTVKHGSQI